MKRVYQRHDALKDAINAMHPRDTLWWANAQQHSRRALYETARRYIQFVEGRIYQCHTYSDGKEAGIYIVRVS